MWKMALLGILGVVVFGFVSFFVWLQIVTRWQDSTGDRDMPWTGPAKKARVFTRKRLNPLFADRTWSYPTVFGASPDQQPSPTEAFPNAINFLKQTGWLEQWPGNRSITESMATGEIWMPRQLPYQFFVVSFAPDVIILVPDPNPPEIAMTSEYAFSPWNGRVSHILGNMAQYGTRFPHADFTLWMSADLKQKPAVLPFLDAGTGSLPMPDGKLVFRLAADQWAVTRE